MNKLLTFELDEKGELLEIHANKDGLCFLKEKIDVLIKAQTNDHIHMMVPSWGGKELSEDKQCKENVLIPHVKVFKWDK